jgi:hypothetical protein
MTPPVPPDEDIGPFYRALGAVLAVGALVMLLIRVNNNYSLTWVDFGMFCVVSLMVLALIRPKFFDAIVKTLADKLPFFSYKKD